MSLPTFLKWAGGKRRILGKLATNFPNKINKYYEPFLGGGAVFFYVKQKFNPAACVISDINKELIDTYLAVRDYPQKLISQLTYFKERNEKSFYYDVREKFNSGQMRGIRKSAAFIYLNKTCFNGLYRVNSNGAFNVPWGYRKNPLIFEDRTILEASRLLQGVEIVCQSYENVLPSINRGDFVYLDPCYDPVKKTSFTSYTPEKFCLKDRTNLHAFIRAAQHAGASVVLSNNDIPDIRRLYSEDKITEISAPRVINPKRSGHGNTTELLIRIEPTERAKIQVATFAPCTPSRSGMDTI